MAEQEGQRVVMGFGEEVVRATLTETAAGREFATQLPLTLEMRDPMGQTKSGRLPAPIGSTGTRTTPDPDAGGIYYVPDSQILAVFYDDLGQTVPAPGLIHLGAVDGDLSPVATAGNRVRVRVDLADSASS
ncbi:MAG TPA: cyclophilin-like fold protein [Microlunatus sp.]